MDSLLGTRLVDPARLRRCELTLGGVEVVCLGGEAVGLESPRGVSIAAGVGTGAVLATTVGNDVSEADAVAEVGIGPAGGVEGRFVVERLEREDRGRDRDRSTEDLLERRTCAVLESLTGEPLSGSAWTDLFEKISRMRSAGETDIDGVALAAATCRVRDRDGRSGSGPWRSVLDEFEGGRDPAGERAVMSASRLRDGSDLDADWWAAWMMGEDVVRYPICEGWADGSTFGRDGPVEELTRVSI